MVNTRNLEDSNSHIEILDRVSEVNIYTILSDYNKSKPGVTVECDSYNSAKLSGDILFYSSEGYKHYINLKDVVAVTLKKLDSSFESVNEVAYLYDSLASYNSEKAVEVPYFGEVKEFFYLADKFMVFEDKEYLHLINVNKLSAVVIKSDI